MSSDRELSVANQLLLGCCKKEKMEIYRRYWTTLMLIRFLSKAFMEGREGVKRELGLALLWTGKMGFTHWDWDLATGNGMNNYKMRMGFLFFSGLCSNILK